MYSLRSPPLRRSACCLSLWALPALLLALAVIALGSGYPSAAAQAKAGGKVSAAKSKGKGVAGKSKASTGGPKSVGKPKPAAAARKTVGTGTTKNSAGKKKQAKKAAQAPAARTPAPTTGAPPTAAPAVARAPQPVAAPTAPQSTAPTTSPRPSSPSRTSTRARGKRGRASRAKPPTLTAVRSAFASGSPAAARGSGGLAAGPAAPAAASGERPSGSTEPDAGADDEGSPTTVTRTVRDIVEVVPGPLKLALGALALISAALAGGYLLTSMRAKRLASQRADLLQDVGLLQTALLPPVPAVVGALRTSVAYKPSEGPGAGGDFYDAMTLPDGKSAFILGDVCGHGRQALARTAFMRYTLRAYLEAGLEPCQALQVAGPVIDQHLGGDFATVVLAVHDPRTGSLTYASAGHPAPLVVGPTRPEPVLAGSSPPIGLGLRTGVRQSTVPLPPGSVACLYTDGLAEARTESGILGRPRLGDILDELGRDATAMAVIDRVAEEARLVTDDMATVVLSPTAGVTVGGFREERLEVNLDEVREGLAERFLEECGVEEPRLSRAVSEAEVWAGSHEAAVLRVRFGTREVLAEVLPRNVESLGAVSRGRALA